MQKRFVFFVGCLAFLFACKKEKGPEGPIEFTLDKDALKYIQFREGQYFIYKDSATGTLDSVVATQSKLTVETGVWQMEPALYDTYHLELTQIRSAGDSIWIKGIVKGNNVGTVGLLLGRLERYFVYPPTCNQCLGIYMLPAVTVEGKTYTNVAVTDNFTDGYGSAYYWAPSVGLIKVVLVEPMLWGTVKRTYTLLRHN